MTFLTIIGVWGPFFLLMDPILVWARIVTSRMETLYCDISSLKYDRDGLPLYESQILRRLLLWLCLQQKMLSFLGGAFKFASNL